MTNFQVGDRMKAALDWIAQEEANEQMMIDTINTDHPDFEDSEEQSAFKNHEHRLAHLALIRSLLMEANPVPIAVRMDVFQPVQMQPVCNCGFHRRGELTGGWQCPVHGQQW